MSDTEIRGPSYSRVLGFIFLFNLILGTGALALPKAFHEAGWLLGPILLIVMATMSFIPATFIVESMAIRNALYSWDLKIKMEEQLIDSGTNLASSSSVRSDDGMDFSGNICAQDFEISRRFELGEIVNRVAGKFWTALFYTNISIYLYGDLAVYAASISKSLRDITCDPAKNITQQVDERSYCFSGGGLTRMSVYRLYLMGFSIIIGPFFFCNVTRTRVLQILTSLARWIALFSMICIASMRIASFDTTLSDNASFHPRPTINMYRPRPPSADFRHFSSLFGVSIYAFMCHHSLPGLITPIRNKSRLYSAVFISAYILIFLLYILLSETAICAFDTIFDLYTLNFVPNRSNESNIALLIAQYFIVLFPVFALSSTFPIIGTTLSNNIQALVRLFSFLRSSYRPLPGNNLPQRFSSGRWISLLPLLALLPPLLIACVTNDIAFLVAVTGAFGGSGIQYLFPVILVFYSRRELKRQMKIMTFSPPTDISEATENEPLISIRASLPANPYCSPFVHIAWLVLVLTWFIVCVFIVFLHNIKLF